MGASKAKKIEFCSSPTILGLFDIKGHSNGICFFCPLFRITQFVNVVNVFRIIAAKVKVKPAADLCSVQGHN